MYSHLLLFAPPSYILPFDLILLLSNNQNMSLYVRYSIISCILIEEYSMIHCS